MDLIYYIKKYFTSWFSQPEEIIKIPQEVDFVKVNYSKYITDIIYPISEDEEYNDQKIPIINNIIIEKIKKIKID